VTSQTPDRRRVARITVPWQHFTMPGLEFQMVRILDLSAEGVHIEHPGHLRVGLVLFVDLPPDLGGVRLTGRVVWTRLRKGEQTFEGDKQIYYQSGLDFVGLTPEQQAALAIAVEILKTGE
jgi:hypothetical protein